jgi:hypothetical protein
MFGGEPPPQAGPGPGSGGGAAHQPARPAGTGAPAPQHYEIRVDGVLSDQWAAWFAGLRLSVDGQQTVLAGPVSDQSALHGILAKIAGLGLSLASVNRAGPGEAGPGEAGQGPAGKAGPQ